MDMDFLSSAALKITPGSGECKENTSSAPATNVRIRILQLLPSKLALHLWESASWETGILMEGRVLLSVFEKSVSNSDMASAKHIGSMIDSSILMVSQEEENGMIQHEGYKWYNDCVERSR